MTECFLVQSYQHLLVGAQVRHGTLEDLVVFDPADPYVTGNILEGRVVERLGNSASFLVDLGALPLAFLQIPKHDPLPHLGQTMRVQITRDGYADKGPKVALAAREATPTTPLAHHILTHVDSPILAELSAHTTALNALVQAHKPHLPIEFTSDRGKLRDAFDLDDALTHLMQRQVALSGGGNLIIEELQTLTFIDVNTKGTQQRLLDTALEAATVILDHVRWRNLSGLIAIDFPRLGNERDQTAVLDAMKKGVRGARVRTDVLGFTNGGLFEIIRQRQSKSLSQFLKT